MKIKRYSPDLCVQMAICDANYIRILKLLPEIRCDSLREIVIPGPDEADDLLFTLAVTESFRYTSTLLISQHYPDQVLPYYQRPEMQIRIYHDANTAEVISYQNHRYFKAGYLLRNLMMYQPDEQLQLNLFLGEWLSLCIAKGISNRRLSEDEPLSSL